MLESAYRSKDDLSKAITLNFFMSDYWSLTPMAKSMALMPDLRLIAHGKNSMKEIGKWTAKLPTDYPQSRRLLFR